MFEDNLIGVVVVVRREPQPFTDGHIALVQTFADRAAIALANARLIEAVERQRTELSRFVSPQVADLISSEEGNGSWRGTARTSRASLRTFAALRLSPKLPRQRSCSTCCGSTTVCSASSSRPTRAR